MNPNNSQLKRDVQVEAGDHNSRSWEALGGSRRNKTANCRELEDRGRAGVVEKIRTRRGDERGKEEQEALGFPLDVRRVLADTRAQSHRETSRCSVRSLLGGEKGFYFVDLARKNRCFFEATFF